MTKTRSAAAIAVLLVLAGKAQSGPFEDCILANMRGVQAPNAAGAIYRACKEKTTPQKCREPSLRPTLRSTVELGKDPQTGNVQFVPFAGVTDEEFRSAQKQCAEACSVASLWSRKFGECSTD